MNIVLRQWNMAIEQIHHLRVIFIVQKLHIQGISHWYVVDTINEITYLGYTKWSIVIIVTINNIDDEIPVVIVLH